MTQLECYNDQQSRFDKSFCQGGSCCDTYCENCGRTYFVTSSGHGDYEEGELESLRKRAVTNPDRYIEVPHFSSVSTFYVDGKQVVIGCICDPTAKWSEFIENNASEITEYLTLFWEDRLEKGQSIVSEADQSLISIEETKHWKPMSDAPRDCTWIKVRTADGKTHRAHWASDTSGEDRPSFEGWFVADGNRYSQIHPITWRHQQG